MTDIAFHTGIANPIDYACRLLRKAYRSGARVAVHADGAVLDRLDQALWTFEPLEFVPHVVLPRDQGDAGRLARTPVLLVRPGASAPPCPVAVTIAATDIGDVGGYERLIAIIGTDPVQVEAGHQRWREYKRAGHELTHVKPAGGE
jgi:DNA polymerase-3 subunit chi